MTTEDVKQIITNSRFNPSLKQRLVLLLPRLGKYTLTGLGKEVSRGDSLIIADYLVSLWENFANLLDELKNKDGNAVDNFDKFLTENFSVFNGEDEFYVLNFVLDARSLAYNGQAKLTQMQYTRLLDFEIELFWYLPKEELLFLFRNSILYLSQKIKLLEYTQAAVYKNDLDYKKDFSRIFSEVLLQNEEKFDLKTVGEWVKSYLNFSASAVFRTDVVQVAAFLTKDADVQKLNNANKNILSEILKLYVWFLAPEIKVDAVIDYIQQIETEKSWKRERLILSVTSKPPVVPSPKGVLPPVAGQSPLRGAAQRPMEEVRDMKHKAWNMEQKTSDRGQTPNVKPQPKFVEKDEAARIIPDMVKEKEKPKTEIQGVIPDNAVEADRTNRTPVPVASAFAGSATGQADRTAVPSAGYRPPRLVNIQDLLNKRGDSGGQSGLGGLPMAGGKNQEAPKQSPDDATGQAGGNRQQATGKSQVASTSPGLATPKSDADFGEPRLRPPSPSLGEEKKEKAMDIDKKLEDLKKKLTQ